MKENLLSNLRKMNEKFEKEPSRTDKYRTMLVRLCKRVLSEAMGTLGVDSYSKSQEVDKFLPEYQKRFEQVT